MVPNRQGPGLAQLEQHPDRIPRIWYYPPSLGVNGIFDLAANIQDGNGDYDLRFGETFFDFPWFDGFDRAETPARIDRPTTTLRAVPRTSFKEWC